MQLITDVPLLLCLIVKPKVADELFVCVFDDLAIPFWDYNTILIIGMYTFEFPAGR